MSVATISLAFPEIGKDLARGFARFVGGYDSHNQSFIKDHFAAPKPIANVGTTGDPFKIVCSAVQFVFVFVVNAIKIKRIGYEGVSYKAMNGNGVCLSVLRKLDLRVAAVHSSDSHHSGTQEASTSTCIQETCEAAYSSKRADLVKAFVTNDRPPLLSFGYWGSFSRNVESLLHRMFDVELLSRLRSAKVRNEVPIVSGYLQKAWTVLLHANAAIVDFARQTSDAAVVGKLVNGLPPRHRNPSFIDHRASPKISTGCTSIADILSIVKFGKMLIVSRR